MMQACGLKDGEPEIWIMQAIFDRDVNSFFDMHPKYIINHKDMKYESDAAEGGGKSPKWMAQYLFDIGTDLDAAGVMTFTFLESDDLLADAEISLTELVNDRDEENGVWIPVNFEGEKAGTMRVVFKYGMPAEPAVPDAEAPAPAAPGIMQPAMTPGM